MANDNEKYFLGWDGTEQIIATVKDLLADKQDKSKMPAVTVTIENGVLKAIYA